MKVGILGESDADEASIRILAEAVLGSAIEIQPIRVRARGWTSVLGSLPAAFKAMHWQDADGLIVVLDSDDSLIHLPAHEADGFQNVNCRYCKLHRTISELRAFVTPRQKPPLKVAIGLAVPAIEAWYLCGLDVHSTEAHFTREAAVRLYNRRRELKKSSYGIFPAPLNLMRQRAIEHAERLAKDLSMLERDFPNGFGAFARSLRTW